MSNLKHKSAIIFYQDNKPILVKEGDYVKIELMNGELVNGTVADIENKYEVCMIYVCMTESDDNYSLYPNDIKRIILVEEI